MGHNRTYTRKQSSRHHKRRNSVFQIDEFKHEPVYSAQSGNFGSYRRLINVGITHHQNSVYGVKKPKTPISSRDIVYIREEAASWQKLTNKVHLFEYNEAGDNFDYRMIVPHYTGINLNQYILQTKHELNGHACKFSLSKILSYTIISDILTVLMDFKAKDIIHRDIKDENIIITQAGEVKIIDFGLATYSGKQSRKLHVPNIESFSNEFPHVPPEGIFNPLDGDLQHYTTSYAYDIYALKPVLKYINHLLFDSTNELLCQLATEIGDNNPASRPTHASLIERLRIGQSEAMRELGFEQAEFLTDLKSAKLFILFLENACSSEISKSNTMFYLSYEDRLKQYYRQLGDYEKGIFNLVARANQLSIEVLYAIFSKTSPNGKFFKILLSMELGAETLADILNIQSPKYVYAYKYLNSSNVDERSIRAFLVNEAFDKVQSSVCALSLLFQLKYQCDPSCVDELLTCEISAIRIVLSALYEFNYSDSRYLDYIFAEEAHSLVLGLLVQVNLFSKPNLDRLLNGANSYNVLSEILAENNIALGNLGTLIDPINPIEISKKEINDMILNILTQGVLESQLSNKATSFNSKLFQFFKVKAAGTETFSSFLMENSHKHPVIQAEFDKQYGIISI